LGSEAKLINNRKIINNVLFFILSQPTKNYNITSENGLNENKVLLLGNDAEVVGH